VKLSVTQYVENELFSTTLALLTRIYFVYACPAWTSGTLSVVDYCCNGARVTCCWEGLGPFLQWTSCSPTSAFQWPALVWGFPLPGCFIPLRQSVCVCVT